MNPGQYANKEQEIQYLKAENAHLRGREVVWREMEQKYAAVLAENARLREATKRAEQEERKARHECEEAEVDVAIIQAALTKAEAEIARLQKKSSTT